MSDLRQDSGGSELVDKALDNIRKLVEQSKNWLSIDNLRIAERYLKGEVELCFLVNGGKDSSYYCAVLNYWKRPIQLMANGNVDAEVLRVWTVNGQRNRSGIRTEQCQLCEAERFLLSGREVWSRRDQAVGEWPLQILRRNHISPDTWRDAGSETRAGVGSSHWQHSHLVRNS